jgi:hypothetical protein
MMFLFDPEDLMRLQFIVHIFDFGLIVDSDSACIHVINIEIVDSYLSVSTHPRLTG